jgi:ACR3 family arsenite efflux pump ArsB
MFAAVRRLVVFILGVLVIVKALWFGGDDTVPELLIGMVLVGVLPLENVAGAYREMRQPPPPRR